MSDYRKEQLRVLLGAKIGLSSSQSLTPEWSLDRIERVIRENPDSVRPINDSKIQQLRYEIQQAETAAIVERDRLAQIAREDQLLLKLEHKDWDDLSENEQLGAINLWRSRFPNYLVDRDNIYSLLQSNQIGTPYAFINNLNAYFSMYARPLNPRSDVTSDVDYYYNSIVPKSATVLWWYENSSANLSVFERTKWNTRIYKPDVGVSTALAAHEAAELAASAASKVGDSLENSKYLIAGSVVSVAVIIAIGGMVIKK